MLWMEVAQRGWLWRTTLIHTTYTLEAPPGRRSSSGATSSVRTSCTTASLGKTTLIHHRQSVRARLSW